MTFNSETEVIPCEDASDLPTATFSAVPINQLEQHQPNTVFGASHQHQSTPGKKPAPYKPLQDNGTPRKLALRKEIARLRSKLHKLEKKQKKGVKVVKSSKIANAKISRILSELRAFLPENSMNFIETQIKMSMVKNHGQRWYLKDKLFAMSIFYQSRKAYKLLKKLFSCLLIVHCSEP